MLLLTHNPANPAHRDPWNKGKLVGPKPPFKLQEIWAIRIRLDIEHRVRELAMLQAIGFRRRAIVLSLVQEATILAAAGSLIAGLLALLLVHGAAVRFTMGAFTLRIDGTAVLIGCGTGLTLGILGAVPPAVRAMRLAIAENLKAI